MSPPSSTCSLLPEQALRIYKRQERAPLQRRRLSKAILPPGPRSLQRRDRVTTPPREDTPGHGCAVELRNLMARNQRKPSSAKQLKVAQTACIMRQWDLCQQAAEAGLEKEGANEQEMKQLQMYLAVAKHELEKQSYNTDKKDYWKTFVPRVIRGDRYINRVFQWEEDSQTCRFFR